MNHYRLAKISRCHFLRQLKELVKNLEEMLIRLRAACMLPDLTANLEEPQRCLRDLTQHSHQQCTL